MATKDRQFFIDVLKSEECQCGRTKRARTSLCYRCYSSLPKDLQRDLWLRMGDGYEEAYDKAVEWLI